MGLINLPKKIYSTTWANRPSASSMNGKMILISDLGYGNSLFVSNGTRWKPMGGSCLVYQTNVATTVTGTSVETTLGSTTVPGGLMSSNGILEISFLFSHTSSATSRNLRGRFGSGAISYLSSTVSTTNTTQAKYYLRNMNSTSSQSCQPVGLTQTYITSTSSLSSFAQDTSIDFNVSLSAALTDTSQFVTLESMTVFYTEG